MKKIIRIAGELNVEYGREICKEIYSWLPAKFGNNTLEIILDSQSGDYEAFHMIRLHLEELKKFFPNTIIITKAVRNLRGPAAYILLLGDKRVFEKELYLVFENPSVENPNRSLYLNRKMEQLVYRYIIKLLIKITRLREEVLEERIKSRFGWEVSIYAGINLSIYTKYYNK